MARRLLPAVAGLSLCLVIMASAVRADAPSVRTDRAVHLPPAAPELSRAGSTFTDPTFGTRMMRVTDQADGPDNITAYSYWPTVNSDSTLLHLNRGGEPTLYRFDPREFRLGGRRPLFSKPAPEGGMPGWEDSIWSARKPDTLYCHNGTRLFSYRPLAGAYTLVRDFRDVVGSGRVRQMGMDRQDRVFAFSLQDAEGKVIGALVWSRDGDRILLNQRAGDIDEVGVDKSGRYAIIHTDRQGKGAIQTRIVDLKTGKTESLTDDGPDYAPGHSDTGSGFILGADNWRNGLTLRRLGTPHDVTTALSLGDDWSQDYHVSLLADDEKWALLSFYTSNKLPRSHVFEDEILQLATDGSGRVRRLAHHRSAYDGNYWDSPRANISRDGRFVAFTSRWAGGSQRDVFILEVPRDPQGSSADRRSR